jgi:hypothetical protein
MIPLGQTTAALTIVRSRLIGFSFGMYAPMNMVIREFYEKEKQLDVQLIFSTNPLTTEFPVIVVGNDLSAMNKTLIVNEDSRIEKELTK